MRAAGEIGMMNLGFDGLRADEPRVRLARDRYGR